MCKYINIKIKYVNDDYDDENIIYCTFCKSRSLFSYLCVNIYINLFVEEVIEQHQCLLGTNAILFV